MYLRRSEVRRGDKTHAYWRLVRSVRRGGEERQETVAMFGELNAKGRAKATALAERFLGKSEGQGSLFDQDRPAEGPLSVHVDRLRVERSSSKTAETESAVGLQIGRMLQRNQRGAAAFEIDILKDESRKSGLELKWRENLEKAEYSRLTDGAYRLRTNIKHWKPEELWATYVRLSHAEAAFRIQKSELCIRPV